MAILVEVVVSVAAAAASGTFLQTFVKAIIENESLRKAIKSLQLRDLAGIMFIGLGVGSLLISYSSWLWVEKSREDWWQSLHLELGVALLLIGFVDTIVMTRLARERSAGSTQ